MQRIRLGIRWWLAIAFAVIAAGTAASIATFTSHEVRSAIESNAQNIAIGKTVSVGFGIKKALETNTLTAQLATTAARERLALFVFSRDRRLIAHSSYGGVSWQSVPDRETALGQALAGQRFARSLEHGRADVVALPIRATPGAAALVAYAPRAHAFTASLSIIQSRVVRVSIWAAVIAALTGFLAATLVARRLHRITETAAAIERGGFDVELRPGFRDEIGSLAGTIDRMRQRLGEAFGEIQAERDKLEILLDRLQEGVIAVDEALTVQFTNSAARAILRAPSLLPGDPVPESGGLPVRQIAERLFALEASVVEIESDVEEGTIVSLVGVPAGTSKVAVLVLTDVTERERRQRAEREFVANASHELRTPVTAIANAVEALEAGAQDEPDSRTAFIRLIGRQSLRLTRLTNSLLILARAQTLEQGVHLVPVTVRPLLEEVVAATEQKGESTIRVDCPGSIVALAEPDILEQVVSNLLGNALRHGDFGEITIRARRVGDEVMIEVGDTGPGISAVEQSRIFDRFYSGAGETRSGFGLGLAIVRESTHAIGGRIDVESGEHGGTVVRLTLSAALLN